MKKIIGPMLRINWNNYLNRLVLQLLGAEMGCWFTAKGTLGMLLLQIGSGGHILRAFSAQRLVATQAVLCCRSCQADHTPLSIDDAHRHLPGQGLDLLLSSLLIDGSFWLRWLLSGSGLGRRTFGQLWKSQSTAPDVEASKLETRAASLSATAAWRTYNI